MTSYMQGGGLSRTLFDWCRIHKIIAVRRLGHISRILIDQSQKRISHKVVLTLDTCVTLNTLAIKFRNKISERMLCGGDVLA